MRGKEENAIYSTIVKPSLLIIGLGNPGASYEKTRHNAGFRALDSLAAKYEGGKWSLKQKFLAGVCEGRIGELPVLFVKPQTFMNRSGEAVKKLVDFYKVDPAFQVLILSDDCDLPLGEVRLRASGGPGTHNGLRSVVEEIGEGFPRIRIGLAAAPAGADLANWVLSVPPAEESRTLDQATWETVPQRVAEFVLGSSPPHPSSPEERGE